MKKQYFSFKQMMKLWQHAIAIPLEQQHPDMLHKLSLNPEQEYSTISQYNLKLT